MSPPARLPSGRTIWRAIASVLSVAAAIGLLAVVFPAATGASWAVVYDRLLTLSAWQVALLSVVWFSGLYAHTYVITGALPRLSHRQALVLNFSGSAVSNLVPFGGALGMGLNYTMLRSWGFNRTNFAVLTVLTNACTVAVKLLLPALALGALVLTGDLMTTRLVIAAIAGVTLAAVVVVLLVTAAVSSRLRDGLRRTVSTLGRGLGRRVVGAVRDASVAVGAGVQAAARRGWRRMTLGAVTYAVLQALLLELCFVSLGSPVNPAVVFAGYAMGRALSILPITPGGVGVAETGAAAVLIALGTDPTLTAAAVLLNSTFTFLLEIPVGAAGTVAWWLGRGRIATPTAAA
ncbi:MAG TPA: lysylphosphatidylglycerol synthase domain-containing protein [Nocardioidaceae bacterium]|nr:lysylphosphatidylglycerol synthase domain-containing protein [Nocardioidaceae bacterium]